MASCLKNSLLYMDLWVDNTVSIRDVFLLVLFFFRIKIKIKTKTKVKIQGVNDVTVGEFLSRRESIDLPGFGSCWGHEA